LSDREQEPDAAPDDRPADEPEMPTEAESALPPKRFRASSDVELDPQSYIISDDRTAAKVTLRGGSVGTESGDAHFIGDAIRILASALRAAAQVYPEGAVARPNPLLRGLAFGQSVTLEFEIGEAEEVQLGLDGVRHSPTLDAARTMGEVLAAEPSELADRAARLGPNATAAYKGFLNVLAKVSVTLEWQVPDRQEAVVITSDHARRDAAILSREGERVTARHVLPGTLTMADSELNQFKLTLPADVERPPLLKGKHRVSGTYAEELEQKLKDENLWDSEVMATIDMTFYVPGTTPTPHPPIYRLVDAEPLIPPPSLFD
jgi:hypothetical protein